MYMMVFFLATINTPRTYRSVITAYTTAKCLTIDMLAVQCENLIYADSTAANIPLIVTEL
jgi:hypothetical protein